MSRILEWRRAKALLGVTVAATFVILGEAAFRFLNPIEFPVAGRQDLMANSLFAGSPELGWVRRPGFRGVFEDGHDREFDDQGLYTFDSPQVHDAVAARILFVGDSNTFGFDVPSEDSFVEVADRLLSGASGINLGVPGYSSAQGIIVAREAIPRLKPRIAVMSFNFNDRRDAQTHPDSAERFRAIYRTSAEYFPNQLNRIAERLHVYRLLQTAFQSAGVSRPERFETATFDLAEARPRVSEQDYERHLTEFVELCAQNGVQPVFLLLRDAPGYAEPVRQAALMIQRGDTHAAIAALEAVIASDPIRSLARIMLAPLYRNEGQSRQAEEVLRIRSLRRVDGMEPVRLDTRYNEIMRRVAAFSGGILVDGATVLDSDPEVFTDECHFDREGHRRVGELLAERLGPLLPVAPQDRR